MIAFLDTETGGFSIEKNGICEISIIVVDEKLNPAAEFNYLIKPYMRPCGLELVSYKDDAMAINGLTVDRLVSEGYGVDQVSVEAALFCKKYNVHKLVGHNLDFDIKRVNYLLQRFAGAQLCHSLEYCTLQAARKKWPHLSSHKQEDLCAWLGIHNPHTHSAKGDCLANIELYKRLIN